MRRKGFVSVLAAVAVAGSLATAGGVAAQTSRPQVGGKVHLTAYADSDEAGATVIVTGVIGDFGEGMSVTGQGVLTAEHDQYMKLALSQGSFQIGLASLDKKFISKFTRVFPATRKTCSGAVSVTGAAPVRAGSGTGAYRGITGGFDLTITVDEVDVKAKCSPDSALLYEEIVITGPGTVSPG
jgi:hypothetical protein